MDHTIAMRPAAFHRGSTGRYVGSRGYYRQLENDIRFKELANPEIYTARTECCAPTSSLSCEMRSPKVLYKLYVSGIYFDTTEENLRHILSNYGDPITVSMIRRMNHPLVAHVEFESRNEAENAIEGLNGKPPLNWEVTYASTCLSDEIPRDCRQDQRIASPTIESERQSRSLPVSDIGLQPLYSRQYSPVIRMRGNDSSLDTSIIRSKRNHSVSILPEFPACVVCGIETLIVCIVCKTRYCSLRCQSFDWPTHQSVCKPLPALVSMEDVSMNEIDLRSYRGCSSIPFHGLQNGRVSVDVQQCRDAPSKEFSSQHRNNGSHEQLSPHSYLSTKGIHPIDRKNGSNQLLSVTMHRELENRSFSKASAEEVRSFQPDSHIHSSHADMQSKGSSLSSPEWKNFLSQCKSQTSDTSSHKRNEISLQNSEKSNERQREVHWGLPAVSKPRNFPLANCCPKTPDSSPRRTSQSQSADASKVYAKKFSSKQLKQPVNKCNQVWVSSAKSPYEFFVQYFCYKDMLQEVMKNVEMSFPNSDPLIDPVEGLPCVAIFPEDHSWYRAEIVKILPDGIGIRYVDYGNSILMRNSPEHLRMMKHHISESPFYAVKVKLANVLPLNGTSWDLDVRHKFKELVENHPFMMEFVQMDADVMCVRLKYQDGSDLLERLLQDNLVRKVTMEVSDELDQIVSIVEVPAESTAQTLSVQNPLISNFQLSTENVVAESNHILKTSSRMNGLVFKNLIKKSAQSCEIKSEILSSMMKVASMKTDEIVPEVNDFPEQPRNKVSEIPVLSMVETESTSPYPAAVNKDEGTPFDNTPAIFFYNNGPFLDLPVEESFQAMIIKVENPKLIYLRFDSEEISTKLAQLKDDLAAYANDVGGSYCPQVQEVCVARFPDGQWYRAFCAYLDGSRYVCHQIDYGEEHAIEANDIRRITKCLVDFVPYLTQHAILKGTESLEECEPKLVNRLQKILCVNTVVDVVVVSRLDVSYVINIPKVSCTLSFEKLI